MKIRLISALFIILIHFSIQLLEEDITTYSLISEMKRVPHLIYSNRAYKFVNSNEKLIYFLEVQDDIEMLDINNNTFKYLVSLSHLNDASIINPKDEFAYSQFFLPRTGTLLLKRSEEPKVKHKGK